MILGLGNDIIDIRRIEKALDRYGERFLARVFTATERAKSDGRVGRAASYAKRFAAKEACAKALGTGFRKGVFWRDMGVVNLRSGRPTIVLTGGAAEQDGQPVGTVFLGIAIAGRDTDVVHLRLPGDRQQIRQFATISLMDQARTGVSGAGRGKAP